MDMEQVAEQRVRLQVENIAGIEQTEVAFEPGVTVLSGRNATNRTSLLQAIMAGLGSNRVSLKGDAEAGSVQLEVGDRTYTRRLEETEAGVGLDGDPYLDDPELADLFAFLLESNEARRSVMLGEDLRDIIMRPIDVEEIQADIRRLQSERDEVEEKLEERESLKRTLTDLEQRRAEVEADVEATRDELAARRSELEELSGDVDEESDEESAIEAAMARVQDKRRALEDVEFRLETQRESLQSLKAEREELRDRRDEFENEELADLDSVQSEIARLRGEKQRLDTEMSKLQSVIQFNKEMLEGTNEEIAAALRGPEGDRPVTDQLLDNSDSVVCWTCGTDVKRDSIEETLERLRSLRQSKYSEKQEREETLSELKERKSAIDSRREERRTVKRRLEDLATEIDKREARTNELEARREELTDRIATLEAEVNELEETSQSETLSVHREINELEVELDQLENERDRLASNIEEIESQIEEIEGLEARKERVSEQLEERRTRIERIETEALETFNDQMESVLDLLEYANIERIWVERVEREVREGRQTVTEPEFRIHVVRRTDDGVTYEDAFEHLSESEREVTALVFTLAGYLAHDVHEEVPFMLLDSLEAIDAERIATLVEYLADYADHLVVALLPEDADPIADDHQRITDI